MENNVNQHVSLFILFTFLHENKNKKKQTGVGEQDKIIES